MGFAPKDYSRFYIIYFAQNIMYSPDTPYKGDTDTPYRRDIDTPMSHMDPIEFFNAWKMESSLPAMVMGKVAEIIGEYYQMKPGLDKKQNEMKILFRYNEKLIQTVEEFIVQEKKVVQKYNALAKLYLDSFQKYCSSKNWDMNFNIKPIRCICEKVNIGDWKFEVQQDTFPPPPKSYQEKLLNIITKHFLNEHYQLERHLDKIIERHNWSHNSEEMLQAEEVRLSIKELNGHTPTLDNMFDLLDKKKIIEYDLRQLDEIVSHQTLEIFLHNDLNFVDEVSSLHRQIFQLSPEKLKEYLENETLVRKKLKKKYKKMRDQMEAYFEKIQLENGELKDEIEIQRKKREDMEKERNNFKSLYEYLQLKGVGTTRKDRNNTVQIEESTIRNTDMGMKETSKKQDTRIADFEAEIKHLKADILSKSKQITSLSEKLSFLEKEQQEIKAKLIIKLDELGEHEEEGSANVFTLLEKVLQIRVQSYRIDDNSASRKQEKSGNDLGSEGPIHIIITESIPMEGFRENSAQMAGQKTQKNRHMDESSLIIEEGAEARASERGSHLEKAEESEGSFKKGIHNGSVSLQNEPPQQIMPETPPPIHLKKNKTSPALETAELLQISEKNAMEEQSKNIQTSKMVFDYSKHNRESSICKDDKGSDKYSVLLKEELSNSRGTILRLREENKLLAEQIKKLKNEIKLLDLRLIEKEKTQPRSFISSLDGDLKNADAYHAQQIETLCQSIAKELLKFEGNELEKMMVNVEDAIKTCRLGETIKRRDKNMNEPPMLSKNLQQDNLFKSDNVMMNLVSKIGKEEEQKVKMRSSFTTEKERSMKLTLQSGEVKLLIKQEKSYYFKNKELIGSNIKIIEAQPPTYVSPEKKEEERQRLEEDDSDVKFQQEDLLEGVDTFNFEGMNWKRQKTRGMKDSDQSLRLSKSNIKNSLQYNKQSELRSSLKIGNKYLDASYIAKLQRKLEDIKNHNEFASDLYWFYRKYKQALEALERSEALIRMHEMEKEKCMNKLTAEGALSRHKLEETIYFLQQRVNELEQLTASSKEEYEAAMTCQLQQMEELKTKALEALGRNFLQMAQT